MSRTLIVSPAALPSVGTTGPVGSILSYAAPVGFDQPAAGGAYPPASLAAYRLHLARQGWLICDGQSLAIARYPRLFRAIGFIYGQGVDGQGHSQPGYFCVPDYRGRGLRGVNGAATDPLGNDAAEVPRDPDAAARISQGTQGWSGNAVGSVQYDALQDHTHSYQEAAAVPVVAQEGGQGSSKNQANPSSAPQAPTGQPAMRLSSENRGKNQYVHFLIRAF